MSKIVAICLSASIQKTIMFNRFNIGEVNRSDSYRFDVSGKAVNAARVLSQLISKDENLSQNNQKDNTHKNAVSVVCPLGEKNASFWRSLAISDNLVVRDVLIPGFTRECCTLLDSDAHSVTELVVEEPSINSLDKETVGTFLNLVNEEVFIKKADALILAGSRPKMWPAEIINQIMEVAKKAGVLVLADFKGQDLAGLFPKLTPQIVKINEKEFCSTFAGGSTLRGDIELADTIRERSEFLKNIIIVTRGEQSTIAADNGKLFYCPTEQIRPVNTIGCGDAFNSGFLYEYLKTGDMQKSLEKGTWCAARNALTVKPGSIFIESV